MCVQQQRCLVKYWQSILAVLIRWGLGFIKLYKNVIFIHLYEISVTKLFISLPRFTQILSVQKLLYIFNCLWFSIWSNNHGSYESLSEKYNIHTFTRSDTIEVISHTSLPISKLWCNRLMRFSINDSSLEIYCNDPRSVLIFNVDFIVRFS